MRKTDKGLPRYQDVAESDVFILSGSEDENEHAGGRIHFSLTKWIVQVDFAWARRCVESSHPSVTEGYAARIRKAAVTVSSDVYGLTPRFEAPEAEPSD